MARHSLLQRQLKRSLSGVDTDAEPWRSFLNIVDEAYQGFDTDRKVLERSLDLSSLELMTANQRLRETYRETSKDDGAGRDTGVKVGTKAARLFPPVAMTGVRTGRRQ